MVCDICGARMKARKATARKPYPYALGGLKDVCLVGITVHHCPECGSEIPAIPRPEELHDVIAEHLAMTPRPLHGPEVRFLRKHVGMPAKTLAAILGISPEHLSRVENGRTRTLGAAADRLVRIVTRKRATTQEARDLIERVALGAARPSTHEPAPARFMLKADHWRAAA